MENPIELAFSVVSKYCAAIYYGGSRVDPVISNPHDYDYICFAKHFQLQNLHRCLIAKKAVLNEYINEIQVIAAPTKTGHFDFSQLRAYPYTHITWFSYLDPLMIKVVGDDVCPKTDIIHEHRTEFITCLKEKANELLQGKIQNQKRWYHLLRGAYILINNSYEVTLEQRAEINTLHDLSEGYQELIEKTIKLIKNLS
jgi:hypothetical protein